MRKYQPIWEIVKKEHSASLAADPSMHNRIIQAVRKEKNKDAGWRLLLGEQGIKYKLKEKVEGSLITFYLVDISSISVGSL